MSTHERAPFDPLTLLRELEGARVNYVLVGTLAGILRGAPEITRTVEICPSLRQENLARLEQALERLGVAPADGAADALRRMTVADDRRFATRYGELVIDAAPDGTRGYDELRRQADRELLDDRGLRVSVSSLGDLLRTMRARDLPDEAVRMQTYRRLNELTLEHERSLGMEL